MRKFEFFERYIIIYRIKVKNKNVSLRSNTISAIISDIDLNMFE